MNAIATITTKYVKAYDKIAFFNVTFETLEEEHKEFLKLYIGYNCNKNLLINKRHVPIIENFLKKYASKMLLNMACGYAYAKRFDKTGDRFPNHANGCRLQSYFRKLLYQDAIENNFGEDFLLNHELFESDMF